MANNEILNIPRHVGIIMDGNRRWAKKRLMPPSAGHSAGLKRMLSLAEKAKELGVRYMTVYALSTENFSRPQDELDKMFALIRKQFNACVDRLVKAGAAVKVIGDVSLLPRDIRQLIADSVKKSPENADFTFIMALGYGSRNEITRAVNTAVRGGKEVTEEEFASLLYTDGIPDPDLIIRTGGEVRLSNFLLWQAAYAELYFSKVLFPDFTGRELERAVADYSGRDRRFGKV
ncbi:MAG: di-trans,poly-cis-decaprenylcistransferase [Clostridia bacterium]|nr:di-trans,poly-cis-decaprenylcistransferase [Clostridia bacterium]